MSRYDDHEEDKKKRKYKDGKNAYSVQEYDDRGFGRGKNRVIENDYTNYILNANDSEINDAYNDNPDLVNNILGVGKECKGDNTDKDLLYDNIITHIYSDLRIYMSDNMININLEYEDVLLFVEDKIPL